MEPRPTRSDPDAQYNLGAMYANGQGVPQDEVESFRWFRLAAEQGHAEAQYSLGVMYSLGLGVLRDFVIAHMWLNIADANGAPIARNGQDYLERDMTPDDISCATELARTCMVSDYQDCGP